MIDSAERSLFTLRWIKRSLVSLANDVYRCFYDVYRHIDIEEHNIIILFVKTETLKKLRPSWRSARELG